MPWIVVDDSPDCDGWAVVIADGAAAGALAPGGCHATEDEATAHAVALNLAETDDETLEDDDDEMGEEMGEELAGETPFIALVAVETNARLGNLDKRVFPEGSVSWATEGARPAMTVSALFGKSEWGHEGAVTAGRVERVLRVDASDQAVTDLFGVVDGDVAVIATGVFDHAAPGGGAVAQLVVNGTLNGVSLDPTSDLAVEEVCVQTARDDYGEFCVDSLAVFFAYKLAGFTVLDSPGSQQAHVIESTPERLALVESLTDLGPGAGADPSVVDQIIEANADLNESDMDDMDDDEDEMVLDEELSFPAGTAISAILDAYTGLRPSTNVGMIASAGPVMSGPNIESFRVAEPDELTPLHIDEADVNGFRRIYGHVAPAEGSGICHIGYPGECKEAPPSPTGYAYFNRGYVLCVDGTEVPTGVLTMSCGHAALSRAGRALSAAEATAHYDNSGRAFAAVHGSNGKHGWWICGVIYPDVTDAEVMRIRGGVLSGDWRGIGGKTEGVAALLVNVPGFPIPRQRSLVAAGKVLAMVATGHVRQCADCAWNVTTVAMSRNELDDIRRRLARQEAITADHEIAGLTAGMRGHTPDDVALVSAALRP